MSHWITWVAVLGLVFQLTGFAPEVSASEGAKKLTVEKIFRDGEFAVRDFPGFQWLPDGKSFVYLKASSSVQRASDLWRYDASSKQHSLWISASMLTLPGADRPISIENFIVAPNGKFILFTSLQPSRGIKSGGNIHLLDLEKLTLRALTRVKDDQRIIQISPDSSKVGFVRSNNLFVHDLSTGLETQLTFDGTELVLNGHMDWAYEEEFGIIDGWKWSPDGESIAFWRLDSSEVPLYPLLNYTPKKPEILNLRYPKAGDPNSKVRIGMVSLKSGRTSWAALGADTDVYVPRIDWMPGSQELAIHYLNRTQNRLELLAADRESGALRPLLSESDETYLEMNTGLHFFSFPSVHVGKFLWLSEKSGFRHIYLHDPLSARSTQLTVGPWEVTEISAVDEARGLVYFMATRESPVERQLYSVSLAGGDVQRVSDEVGTHRVEFSMDRSFYVDWFSTANQPPRISLHQASGELSEELESNELPQLKEYGLGKTTFFSFITSDGVLLHGSMLLPSDFDPTRKYPVLMHLYGGPGAQQVRDQWGGVRGLWHQMMAQQGYVIVSVDNRGTDARGREFRRATYRRMGELDSQDQIETAKMLSKLAWVDVGRIGIWGWSYGGYLTAMTMARGGSIFKAGISVAPVSDWQHYDSIYTERYMSTPAENPEGYRNASVMTHIPGLTGSMLLVHGTGDDNVHFQNSVVLVDALIENNKPFEVAYYPNRMHGISEGKNTRLHLYSLFTRFILKNL